MKAVATIKYDNVTILISENTDKKTVSLLSKALKERKNEEKGEVKE